MRLAVRHLVLGGLLTLLTSIAVMGQAPPIPASPSLKFQGVDGKVYDLAAQRGNVVLLSFGATWCAPCTTELRALQEILAEYQKRPVKFFWVSIERPEEISNSDLRRYAKERKVSFPVLRDDAKMVFSQFSPRVRLPLIVMLGKDGKIDAPIKFGMQSQVEAYKAEIRARLNKLLITPSPVERATDGEGLKRTLENR